MGNMAESIEKLVRRAKKGDQEAFIALMESQKLSMSRIALSILHNEEDAADAIGRRCWRLSPSYAPCGNRGFLKPG